MTLNKESGGQEADDSSAIEQEVSKQVARPEGEPAFDQVYRYLMFGASLPERAIRSTAAMLGGAIHESASLLVPQAFKDSKTYDAFVQQMLDLLAKDIGGVKKEANAEDDPVVENYVAKKTVSTFVDFAGMATLHISPLTVLAIVSDVAYGSKVYLNQLTEELKREGIISKDSVIGSTAELLDAVSVATGESVDVLDTPPLSVDGLRETIDKTTENISKIDPALLIPQSEIAKMWEDMQSMAAREEVNLFEVSSAMTLYALGHVSTVSKGALTTIRVTGGVLEDHLIDHYREGLNEIMERGIYVMLSDSCRPYVDAVWYNFSSNRPTVTEDIFSGKMAGRVWEGMRGWFNSEQNSSQNEDRA